MQPSSPTPGAPHNSTPLVYGYGPLPTHDPSEASSANQSMVSGQNMYVYVPNLQGAIQAGLVAMPPQSSSPSSSASSSSPAASSTLAAGAAIAPEFKSTAAPASPSSSASIYPLHVLDIEHGADQDQQLEAAADADEPQSVEFEMPEEERATKVARLLPLILAGIIISLIFMSILPAGKKQRASIALFVLRIVVLPFTAGAVACQILATRSKLTIRSKLRTAFWMTFYSLLADILLASFCDGNVALLLLSLFLGLMKAVWMKCVSAHLQHPFKRITKCLRCKCNCCCCRCCYEE